MRRSHVTGFLFWIFCERAWSEARRAGRQAEDEGGGGAGLGVLFHRGPGNCFFPTAANGKWTGGWEGVASPWARVLLGGGGEMCASGEGEKAWGFAGAAPLAGRTRAAGSVRAVPARVAVVARRLV